MAPDARPCWYMESHSWTGPRGRVQVDRRLSDGAFTLPEPVLRLAQAQYEHQFGHCQDYERMQERMGLSVLEVVGLLADYVERLGGKGTEPRADSRVPSTPDEPDTGDAK